MVSVRVILSLKGASGMDKEYLAGTGRGEATLLARAALVFISFTY